MLKEAIYHRPKNNFAYAYNQQTLHIRIHTKKNDIKEVHLHFQDPFKGDSVGLGHTQKPMKKMGSNQLFDYWQVEVTPPHRRVEYYFEFIDHDPNFKPQYYSERGFFEDQEKVHSLFRFPFINPVDVLTAPEWVKETVWYQIFPERFANGNSARNPENTLEWGSAEPTPENYFGGDLDGVIEHLDHLTELGVTGIYFNPIFKAMTNHKYDTIDYLQIDPHFGEKETLKKLVSECHDRGIRVMLDAVFNHCGFYFEPFQDVLKHGEKSKYKDWFHIHEFPVRTEPLPNYDTFSFTHMMPKFNTENDEVKDYLLGVARYWIEECDIDGWRLDVSNEVDHAFWREFRKVVKNAKSDVYILGEIWNDSMPWLQGDQFDAVMNYPFTDLTLDLLAKERISIQEYKDGIEELLYKYPLNVNEVAFNLLGSHDTPRMLTIAKGNKEKLKQLFLTLLTFSGSPCIYYGDEIGMDGELDPGCRKCMVWDKEMQDREILEFVKHLISLRKNNKALSHGVLIFREEANVLVYDKTFNNEKFTIVINPSAEAARIDLDMSHMELLLGNGLLDGEIPGNGYLLLKEKK
ncbi:glycoside hydrolase family 13 protein [Bacillus massilinigeriensis]|uniref:glycoside hydrolase family 13 protein n=1 Tax=Bacillus massilionigeriensis TaxID=1805475 RepID=UPI00096B0E33|nr:glycoside hydrolase family 13 protein [Bacillus massilionigeriensis]